MAELNETHDPALSSWVDSANGGASDFPVQNLPFGVFRRLGSQEAWRGGVAIGDQILDLGAAHAAGVFSAESARAAAACTQTSLNAYMAMGPAAWSALRLALSRALRKGSAQTERLRGCLVAQAQAEYAVPARIGDYTDFYTSIHHATSVGRLYRPDHPLLPNYKWVPIGYHGRASSIGVSGLGYARPRGQILRAGATAPELAPSERMDYELEIAVFIGRGNELGRPIPVAQAESHVFGLALFNDWSARDFQSWEYQPLGPFLSKNFASTLSPWIVTMEALAPYRKAWTRPPEDPQPLPYLDAPGLRETGAIDIELEVLLQTRRMREAGLAPARVSLGNFADSYWTVSQLVAHHTVNGCNLQSGDLLGSGTQSGPLPQQAGSLLELSRNGQQAISLPDGQTRRFLEDGDAVFMRGWCSRPGAARIGFGDCVGTLLPADPS
ncbi:MAG: fumarylacetoacetase [Burkholderiales bacterium]|nr:fumarylacetoacetase [Burkholderiales bacterium]MDE1925824.1 fumarylacetoacetase [Burkholderiales bacterium]MDE2160325.1 fumarylacetoacetase [Burkholderiales bacterium]